LCALCVLAGAYAGAAELTVDAWEAHPVALEAHAGIATPVGALGVMVDVAPASWVSVGCGTGLSLGGLQLACMMRPRFVFKRNMGVHLGVGASMGPHEQGENTSLGALGAFTGVMSGMAHSATDYSQYTWERAYWTNFEVGFERRLTGGLCLRSYAGLAHMLNFEDREYHLDDNPEIVGPPFDDPQRNLVYVGAAVGKAF
jgi:hypothetical protein